ncbi:MAG TPA: flagellar biosynthesis protein FlhB [Clostridiales bacterium]|nr:flagellar biosynthesis protein FlhB [Clostridiales bacterium]
MVEYNLQYFADSPAGDKTEDATSKKLSDARKEGQVAKSKELNNAASLIMFFLILKLFVGFMSTEFINAFRLVFSNIDRFSKTDIGELQFNDIIISSLLKVLIICMPIFIITVVVDVAVNLFQVKWKITSETMKPKLNKINPMSGLKRIFSTSKLIELIFSILKFIIIVIVVNNTIKKEWSTLIIFYDMSLDQAVILMGDLILNLGIKISLIFLIIGVADFFYQKFKFKKDMMMSKQEVKDEYKQTEGDPQTKSKIRAKMREVAQRRMMSALPQADVIITNPTHFAVAIKYDKDLAEAPILLAKGADYLAGKIKEVAKENNIEIVENKPLARMLYYNVEIGDEVPPELYQLTAEVLAYVYGLKEK